MTAEIDRPAAHSDKPPQPAQPSPPPFEAALAELGELVNRLESGTLGLSESIGAYEKGVVLLHGLHEQLAAVEERVRMLVRVDEHGRPILETPDVGKPGREKPTRTAARSGRAKRLPGMDDAGEPL